MAKAPRAVELMQGSADVAERTVIFTGGGQMGWSLHLFQKRGIQQCAPNPEQLLTLPLSPLRTPPQTPRADENFTSGGGGVGHPHIRGGGGCRPGLQGPQAQSSFPQYKCLKSGLQRLESAAVCSPPVRHTGTGIVTGCAEVWACVASLARGMRQWANGSDKWQGSWAL